MTLIRQLSFVFLIVAAFGSSGPRTSADDGDLTASAQAWQTAINSKDVPKLVSYFDDHATAFYPRSQPSVGKMAEKERAVAHCGSIGKRLRRPSKIAQVPLERR